MDHPKTPTRPKPPEQETKTISNPLKYAFDGRFFPTTPPDDDTPKTTESPSNSETGQSSGSGYSNPTRPDNLAGSLGLIASTMLRMELAELEMMKGREIARLAAEKRRAELEDEMVMMILQTQSQIASFVSQNSSSRKRKSFRVEDNSSTSGTNKK